MIVDIAEISKSNRI